MALKRRLTVNTALRYLHCMTDLKLFASLLSLLLSSLTKCGVRSRNCSETQSRKSLIFRTITQVTTGTDLMSKQILSNPLVMDYAVEIVFGYSGKSNYSPSPTEWPNRTISDILYLPISQHNGRFPPILVEVQHTVDDDFIIRLMSYAISIYRQYNQKPIVLTFVISSLKYEVSRKTVQNKEHPYLRQYSCQPWAEACYFITADSIKSSLVSPLSPFVALSTFFLSQHPSLLVNPWRNDRTIRFLYTLAAKVFQDQMNEDEKPVEDLMLLCENTEVLTNNAISALSEKTPDIESCKKILDEGKLLPAALKRKYEEVEVGVAADTSKGLNGAQSLSAYHTGSLL